MSVKQREAKTARHKFYRNFYLNHRWSYSLARIVSRCHHVIYKYLYSLHQTLFFKETVPEDFWQSFTAVQITSVIHSGPQVLFCHTSSQLDLPTMLQFPHALMSNILPPIFNKIPAPVFWGSFLSHWAYTHNSISSAITPGQ